MATTTSGSGTATTVINRPCEVVWASITDVTRMGEWSPECLGGRWVGGADGPAAGAKFEGHNAATIGGRTVKKWTTTSEVTVCEPGTRFEFVAEGLTTWRYDLEASGSGTRITESFRYEPNGFTGFIYETLMRRSKAMTKGIEGTLARLKTVLEAAG